MLDTGVPPQLLVLLWHHAIYYKRHWVLLIWTISKPILLFFLLYFLVDQAEQTGLMDRVNYEPCNKGGWSPHSDGPLSMIISTKLRDTLYPTSWDPNKNIVYQTHCLPDKPALLDNQYYRTLENVVKSGVDDWDNHLRVSEYSQCRDKPLEQIEHMGRSYVDMRNRPICAMLLEEILFYPNNTDIIQKIMSNVDRTIRQYEHFTEAINSSYISSPPEYAELLKYLQVNHQFEKNRIITRGFSSLAEVKVYTQNLSLSKQVEHVPGVLGVVSFMDMPSMVDGQKMKLKYSILYDTVDKWVKTRDEEDVGWVQDLVERAIVEVISNRTVNLGLVLKETPMKCWQRAAVMGYKMFLIILSFGTCFAFLGPPSTFLSEILVEKQLKMREYLYIMGVNSITLKLSWILFYSLFIFPLSVIYASLLVGSMAAQYLTFSDASFMFLLIIGYNLSMLCFCYMLSNAFNDPKSSTQMLYCFHMIVLILCTVQFGTNMPPGSIWLARLASFHPVVPLYLGFSYMMHWEMQWQGVSWNNLNMAPVVTDTYGGLGEALRWMYFDIIVYFALAWYFEKIFPGEFGQKLPIHFLFTPGYWKSEQVVDVPILDDPVADVENMHNKKKGVVIDKMTKVYVKGKKVALNQLSLIFYKNDITAFVGHNGAGKSTLMNILVGLINPSSGKASVNGLDVKTQMEKIRKILGFVPQYDILYPTFTVQEHLQFFGWLRGLSEDKILEATDPMLTEMGLMTMKTQITTVLSGGQKRKLSIITAYLGSPEMIIFDEPTSGVDPFSRRSIWDTILSNKRDSTTILSTHFMDEADLLGDGIAIIHEGELKCSGTPMYLKSKYGKGYRLTIARDPDCSNKDQIIQFIVQQVPGAKFTDEHGGDLDFSISKETAYSANLLTALQAIESKIDGPMGIFSYGLHEPTIEEVFFSSIKKDSDKDEELEGKDKFVDQVEYTNETSVESLGRATWALFRKRALFTLYSPSVFALTTVIPMTFIMLLVITSTTYYVPEHAIVRINDPSRTNVMFVQGEGSKNDKATTDINSNTLSKFMEYAFKFDFSPPCPGEGCGPSTDVPGNLQTNPTDPDSNKRCYECDNHCQKDEDASQKPSGVLPRGGQIYRLPTTINLTNWMLLVNQSKEIVIGGFQFFNTTEEVEVFKALLVQGNPKLEAILDKTKKHYVTISYQGRLNRAMLNLWNTMLLRTLSGKIYDIEMSLQGEELVHPSMASTGRSYFDIFNDLLKGFWIISAMAFGSFGILIAVHYESSTGLKRLQIMYGANPFLYWMVNLCFDMLQYFITISLTMGMVAIFENPFKSDIGVLVVMATITGIQTITFFYFISCVFARSKGMVNLAIFMTLFSSVISLFLGLFELVQYNCTEEMNCNKELKSRYGMRRLQECRFGFAATWNTILTFIPTYVLSHSIHTIGFIKAILFSFPEGSLDHQCEEAKCFCALKSVYSNEFLGQQIVKSIVWSILYFISVLALEWFDVHYVFNTELCRRMNVDKSMPPIMDADVMKEAERVNTGQAAEDNLIVTNLHKCYPDMKIPAVSDLTFAVSKAEVFGLLGLNGAGKTTTFNMLTGYQIATSGSATILGSNLFGTHWRRFKNSSYCPQENTLFQSLTIEQHLHLFSALRRIPTNVVDELIDLIIKEVGLDIHRGKKAGQLSGGNQRKLNFAIALIDYRPVIFLDEPTSGMDPGARRCCWSSIKRAVSQRNCSVVLTSHSMDECEALCHRVVIMVAGSFVCIGSIQYLKNKFGEKYMFKIKIGRGNDRRKESANIKSFIQQALPSSRLEDEHAHVLSFDVPCSELFKLSSLYKVMHDCRKTFNVEDVSVTQTTLEQVFINMAKHQDDLQTGTETVIPVQDNPNSRVGKRAAKSKSNKTNSRKEVSEKSKNKSHSTKLSIEPEESNVTSKSVMLSL